MTRTLLLCCALLGLPAAETLFPEFSALPPHLAMPAGAPVTSDAGGSWLVAGQRRFLVGVQLTNGLQASLTPTSGYDADLKWLYEQPLTWENAQRLGLDSLGYFVSDEWLRAYQPGYTGSLHRPADERFLTAWLQGAQLPVYVDCTCFPWTHGALAKVGGPLPAEALNAGGADGERNHWVPYSACHPAGIALYRAMWTAAVQGVRARGVQPLFYELFNEPGYDDPGVVPRAQFATELAARYDAIAALNHAWGSSYASFAAAADDQSRSCAARSVAWGRFMEERFTALVAEGVRTVRELDPAARCAVQGLGGTRWRELPQTNVNLEALAPHLQVIETPTGGGIPTLSAGLEHLPASALATPDPDPRRVEGILARRFLNSIAGDKPIVDGELYAQADAGSTVAALWLEAARGGNGAWLFEWGRRAWDPEWLPAGSEAGGRRVAAKFPWYLLNPFGTPTDVLTAPLTFRREFARAGAPFASRERGMTPRIALLWSAATERYAAAAGTLDHHQIRTWAGALEYAHFSWDVVTEDQLAAGAAARYAAILAPGVRNVLASTPEQLRTFVAHGGLLIAGGDALGQDEYGQPISRDGLFSLTPASGAGRELALECALPRPTGLPGPLTAVVAGPLGDAAEWQPVAQAEGQAAVVERTIGTGRLVFVGAKLGTYPLAALLGCVLQSRDLVPAVTVLREDGQLAGDIEAHGSRMGSGETWLLVNSNQVPLLVALRPSGMALTRAVEPLAERQLPVQDGAAWVMLPPGRAVVVACNQDAAALPLVTRAELEAEATALATQLAAQRAKARAASGDEDPPIDPARLTTVDLRSFVNRSFLDRVAGDGKGGWTDQGAGNSLDGVPFGRQVWRGIPFDLIRSDENADRTCLVLASPRMPGGSTGALGIPIAARAGALHLLLAAAWSSPDKDAIQLVVHYAEGESRTLALRCGNEVGDWWLDSIVNRAADFQARIAFRNANGRGLFAWRWENPDPQRTIASIDLLPGGRDAIGIVVAVTREDPDLREAVLGTTPRPGWTTSAWNDAATAFTTDSANECRWLIRAGRRGWCGGSLNGPAILLDAAWATGRIEFTASGVAVDGSAAVLPSGRIRLVGRDTDGREREGAWSDLRIASGRERQHLWLPLTTLLPVGLTALTRIDVMLPGDVPTPTGIALSDLRLVR
jgi:hypothetical protein